MPQLQVVNTTRDNPEPTSIEKFFTRLGKDYKDRNDQVEIGKILQEYQTNRQDENAFENAQLKLMQSTVSPSRRIEAQKELNEVQKLIIQKNNALNSKVNKMQKTEEEKNELYNDLIEDGWPPEEAKIYLSAPPGVQGSLERNHRMEKARGIRKNPQKTNTSQQQIKQNPLENPEGISATDEEIIATPEGKEEIIKEEEWPDLPPPENMIPAEKIKWENKNEATNIKELKEVEAKKKVYRDNKILINGMQKAVDSKKLPKGLAKMLVIDPETGDIRPTAQAAGLINKETEDYVKNLKKFLKGAKEFFGARVTNFDVTSFMAQLPGLLTSEQGKRLILKQMELVNELESIHANEIDEGLKKYGRKANYIDISRTVDERVAKRESEILKKIDQVAEASDQLDKMADNPEKFKDTSLMITPEGTFKAVKKDLISKYESKGWSVY